MNKASSGAATAGSTSESPDVDLVLTFESRNPNGLGAKKTPDASDVRARLAEYERLVQQVEHVGLDVTARPARHNEALLLIFVRAPDATLIQRAKHEGLFDYLHGVQSDFEPAATTSLSRSSSLAGKGAAAKEHSQAQSFSSADRIRLSHALLTRPRPQGADVRVGSPHFPHLRDITPLHDHEYNSAWLKRWSNVSSVLKISNEE